MRFNKTGFIITSILITIGADLWYTRSDFQPQPQDFSELMNALQERCLSTRFSTNGTYQLSGYDVWAGQPVIVSNGQYSIVNDGDDVYSFFNGTNSIPYSIPALQPVAPYTNHTQIGGPGTFNGGEYVLSYNAIALDKTYIENDPTNRWILGTYESFTVTGFPEAEFNGTYMRHYNTEYYDGTWYVYNVGYTNAAGCTMSPGETETTFENSGGWFDSSYYSMQFPPWFGMAVSDSTWMHDPPYPDFYITCERGPLATNLFISTAGTNTVTNAVPVKITDRPCYKKTYIYDWVLDNRKPRWADFFGVIDTYLLGVFQDGEHINTWGWFTGWLYSPMARPSLTNSVQDYYGRTHGYDHAFFIKPAKWGVGSFLNLAELEMDIPGLGITNVYNLACQGFTQPIYAFDEVSFSSNQWYYTTAPGSNATQIVKHAFDQRRAALQQCTVLRMHGGRAQWVPPNVTNNVRWSGTVWSTNGYADVCAKAKVACTNKGTEVGAPYSWCYAQVSLGTPPNPNTYFMGMRSRDAKMVMFLDTNNQCEASTYVRASQSTVNYAYATNRVFGNDSNISLNTNCYQKIDAIPMAYRDKYDNAVVQNYNNIYPPIPVSNGVVGIRSVSYSLEADQSTEVITKWDFQYCKP